MNEKFCFFFTKNIVAVINQKVHPIELSFVIGDIIDSIYDETQYRVGYLITESEMNLRNSHINNLGLTMRPIEKPNVHQLEISLNNWKNNKNYGEPELGRSQNLSEIIILIKQMTTVSANRFVKELFN